MSPSLKIPILMYHSVSDSDDYGDLPSSLRPAGYRTTVADFQGHLAVLREGGWSSIRLDELVAVGEGGRGLPERSVILTFDDGYADNRRTVLPLLGSRGFGAAFFPSVGYLGRPGMLDWAALRDLLAAGMEIGSHGMSHEILNGRREAELRWELEASKERLEEQLEAEIRYFSLPRGYLPSALPRLARVAGYRGLCTSRPGFNTLRTDPFRLRRFPIRTGFSPRQLEFLLSGRGKGYARIYLAETIRNLARVRYRRRAGG